MVGTDDVQAYATKFQNQLSKVDDAPIDDRDRDAIHRFVRAVDARGSVNQGTMTSNLNRLRLTAERADTPLVEMDKEDVDAFLFGLKHDRGLSEGTIRNYRKALRKFYRERDEDWAEDIKIGASPSRTVDPNELLTEEEIKSLLDATGNPRDKALIALLADTGLRIGAIASLRIRDLGLEDDAALVSINEDANVKDASGTIPLTWSEGFVANWLSVHPQRDVADAAVIHKMGDWFEDGEDGAMTYQYLSRRVKMVADEAGIDRARVNTHNFRKTAISRWIREGLPEQAIKHRACWDVDTDQIKTYSGVRDEELNDQILDHYGIAPSAAESRPDLEKCERCGVALQPEHPYCPGCAAPLTAMAAEVSDDVDGALRDYLVTESDGEKRAVAAETASAADNDPEFAAALIEELEQR